MEPVTPWDMPSPTRSIQVLKKVQVMLRWSIVFFILSVVAAIFGFGGIAADTAWIAKILFIVFLVIFVLSLLGVWTRRTSD